MSSQPWNSIGEGVVHLEERQLSYTEAMASPCATCQTAPCCTHLPLHTFRISNMMELDHAVYLLNFDRIQLGLAANGDWSVYYVYPCRFLERQHFTCTVHNTAAQPQICVHYNPYNCWYKRVLTKSVSPEFLQIDRQRMAFILEQVVFDEFRNLVAVPDWEAMIAAMTGLPMGSPGPTAEPATSDPALEEWQRLAVEPVAPSPNGQETYSYQDVGDPCSGCQAYCCQTLVFPQGVPTTASSLDYYRFVLGFPGLELGISDNAWSIVVKTTCRHLEGNRCGIFGQPERPLLCKYYDAWKCTYRLNFGRPRPNDFVRVRLEEFEALTACFEFDAFGNIVAMPQAQEVRNEIEDNWRANGARPSIPVKLLNPTG